MEGGFLSTGPTREVPFLCFFFSRICLWGEKKKFFFILNVCAYCKTNSLEPFLNTECWVGVRVSQIPSPLLLVFLPKVGNESGQASSSRISSDYLSQEEVEISRFRSLLNFLKDITWAWAWCTSRFDITIHLWLIGSFPWACTMEEVGGWGEKVFVKNLPLAHRILPFLATVDLTSLAFTHFHPYRLCFWAPWNPYCFLKYCRFTPCVFLMLCLSLEGLSPGSRAKSWTLFSDRPPLLFSAASPLGNLCWLAAIPDVHSHCWCLV